MTRGEQCALIRDGVLFAPLNRSEEIPLLPSWPSSLCSSDDIADSRAMHTDGRGVSSTRERAVSACSIATVDGDRDGDSWRFLYRGRFRLSVLSLGLSLVGYLIFSSIASFWVVPPDATVGEKTPSGVDDTTSSKLQHRRNTFRRHYWPPKALVYREESRRSSEDCEDFVGYNVRSLSHLGNRIEQRNLAIWKNGTINAYTSSGNYKFQGTYDNSADLDSFHDHSSKLRSSYELGMRGTCYTLITWSFGETDCITWSLTENEMSAAGCFVRNGGCVENCSHDNNHQNIGWIALFLEDPLKPF